MSWWKNISDSEDSKFLRSEGAKTLAINVSSILLLITINLVLTNSMGAEKYGEYALAISYLLIFATLGTLGFDKLLVREVAKSKRRAKHLTTRALLWALLTSVLLALGVSELADYYHHTTLSIIIKGAPFLTGIMVIKSSLEGLRKVALAHLIEKVVRPLLLLVGVFFLIDSGGLTGPTIVATVDVWVYGIVFGGLTVFYLLSIPKGQKSGAMMKAALPFLLISAVDIIDSHTDVVMLGALADKMDVGLYNVAKRMAVLLSLGLFVLNSVQASVITKLWENKELEELQKVVTRFVRIVFALAVVGATLLIVFDEWVLSLFGAQFIRAKGVLLWLIIAQLVNIAFGSVGYILSMTGHEKLTVMGLGIGLVVNIVLNALLIPLLGVEGAGIATLTATIVWNAIMYYLAKLKTGIKSSIVG